MMDAANSDDERYANESFENESDTEVPEMAEFESETTENSDDDDENLPSVKANTGPIKIKTFSNNYINSNKTDVVPFASSSEEEDEVVVGQTLAEINTPSMLFEETSVTSISRLISVDCESKESSVEIIEEEDDEEEELKKIQLMEETYLQQISEEMREIQKKQTENLNKKLQLNTDDTQEDYVEISQSDSENDNEVVVESEEEQVSDYADEENASHEEYCEENIQSVCKFEEANCSLGNQNDIKGETAETLDQTKLVQIIQTSLTNLRITSSQDNEERRCSSTLSQDTKLQNVEAANVIDTQEIALAVANALKCAGFNNLNKSQTVVEKNAPDVQETSNTINECIKTKSFETNESEMVHYKNDFEEEKEVEVEKIENSYPKNNDQDIYYDGHFDYRITSKTPTSFNSDDYIFHANFIKTFYRTDSIDKLRAKPYPRKSMSFSNERMREIERHNQILLRKILTQKPTYNLKSKPSQSSVQKLPSQTSTRLTTSALNRKKQQQQIHLDNQVLKRKIEAITLRRRPFIT